MQLLASVLNSFSSSHHEVKSTRSYSCAAKKIFFGTALSLCIVLLILVYSSAQASSNNEQKNPENLNIPWEFGEVIYRIYPQSPKQLYIVGISHRDPNSGGTDSNTLRAQMEIFRIGEWLKNNMNLTLLLPEGYFFRGKNYRLQPTSATQTLGSMQQANVKNDVLRQQLATDEPFKNAEMLLMEYLSFHASQVEDEKIYDAVRNSLGKLKTESMLSSSMSTRIMAELRHLQEVRTVHLLQKIPSVIEDEFHDGTTSNHCALFTIGLNHIKHIYRYITTDRISIASSNDPENLFDELDPRLNLLKRGYGITIIIPRTLADNPKLLKMTGVDRIVLAVGK